MKNIPIPSTDKYMKTFIAKTEDFLKRLRWKAFFLDNENQDPIAKKETYGFRTPNTPPITPDLTRFEDDMYTLMRKIEFTDGKSTFQHQLDAEIKKLRKPGKVVVPADKTTNLYLLDADKYEKLVTDNVTQNYRKSDSGRKDDINLGSAAIARSLDLVDRVQAFTEKNCFITLKDHKDNFKTNPKCRLINPAKNELGLISKHITGRKVKETLSGTDETLNLWRNTQQVLDWFKAAPKGGKARFVKFDIVEFYPSITEELLNRALDFAQQHTKISSEEKEIIKHCKRSLLFHKGEPWEKKDREFDVTMGSYDGAESCEIVGLYMLDRLKRHIDHRYIGLYRDDGLAIIPHANGPMLEKLKKQITATFKAEGLRITVEASAAEVDFLDVTLNLENGKYRPYRKPNDRPLYINTKSNHPPTIIRQLPKMINQRLSSISCNKEEFDKAKGTYQEALKKSGHDHQLQYEDEEDSPSPPPRTKRKRSRKVIWYNPPYSSNVSTNIGRKFLGLIEKHFPKGHRLNKIFNKNTIKLSYSCMPNVGSIVSSTRNQVSQDSSDNTKPCNCKDPTNCPLDGECLQKAIVYEATLQTSSDKHTYIGLTANTFKSRYGTHLSSFRHEKHRLSTELSKKVWELNSKSSLKVTPWFFGF